MLNNDMRLGHFTGRFLIVSEIRSTSIQEISRPNVIELHIALFLDLEGMAGQIRRRLPIHVVDDGVARIEIEKRPVVLAGFREQIVG